MVSLTANNQVVERFKKQTLIVLFVSAALLVAMSFAPFVLSTNITSSWIKLFYLVTLATTWNLMAGYAGMVSVGQQAYIGLGAYGVFVFNDFGFDPYSSAFFASVAVGLISIPISFIAFRLRGGYFAIGTWVIAEATRQIVIRFDSLGSGRGRSLSQYTEDAIYRNLYNYWTALAIMAAIFFVTFYLLRSKAGIALQSIRDNEVAAKSMGINVNRTKRLVFVVASVGAAGSGAIICLQGIGVASPNAIFGINYAAFMIFMVIIGGIGTIEGPIVGALVYYIMDLYFSQLGLWYLVILGVLAILITLYLPRGIWGELSHKFGWKIFNVGHQVMPSKINLS